MALYFVRHGETDWNRAKRFQSTTDVPLNARGLAQAVCMRTELDRRGLSFAAAYCSPLSRAVDTARILVDGTATPLTVEPALLEMSFGDWEGLLETELAGRFGDVFTTWRESHYTTAPPGGESIASCAPRVAGFAERIAAESTEGDVLIVAHQAIMMAVKAKLSGRGSVDDAVSYKQNNDELDIWDAVGRRQVEKLKVDCPE